MAGQGFAGIAVHTALALNSLRPIFSSIDLYLEAVRFDLKTDIDTVGLGVRITF